MSNPTTQQIAELLLGIARSQLAIADAMESSKAGFKSIHLRSTVEAAARLKVNRPVALVDLPARLLLQMLGRTAPTAESVVRELEALMVGGAASAAPSATVGAAASAAASGDSLDMTTSP